MLLCCIYSIIVKRRICYRCQTCELTSVREEEFFDAVKKPMKQRGISQECGSFSVRAEQLQWCLSILGLEPVIPTSLTGHLFYKKSKKNLLDSTLCYYWLQLLTTAKLGLIPLHLKYKLTFKNVTHPVIQTFTSGSFEVAWEISTHESKNNVCE